MGKYKCKYCKKTYKNKVNRDKHIQLFCEKNPDSQKSKEAQKNLEVLENLTELQHDTKEDLLAQEIKTITGDTIVVTNEGANEGVNEVVQKPIEKNTDKEYLQKYFTDKGLDNIKMNPNERIEIQKIYTKLFNKPININCPYQITHAFTTLWYWYQSNK